MEVSILDAKGIKVYKRTLEADEFGMAETGLPLSTEPNLGLWKITALSQEQETQLDVRVDEYVLPKYEVSVDLPRQWALAGDAITGAVTAEYSFGKPVRGQLEIVASRYVGDWEEYAALPVILTARRPLNCHRPATSPACRLPVVRATCSWKS